MGCTQSKAEHHRAGGHFNFRRQETFGRIFLDKYERRVVKKTKNREGKEVKKATHDEPMTFDELVYGMKDAEIDSLGRPIGPDNFFWRTPEVDARREQAYAGTEDWESYGDRLHHELFGWEKVKGKDGKFVAKNNHKRKELWMPNEYPYAWEEGVSHDLCWVSDLPALSKKECMAAIEKNVGPGKDVVWFTNSMKNRSVPEIDHIQVIYRDSP